MLRCGVMCCSCRRIIEFADAKLKNILVIVQQDVSLPLNTRYSLLDTVGERLGTEENITAVCA